MLDGRPMPNGPTRVPDQLSLVCFTPHAGVPAGHAGASAEASILNMASVAHSSLKGVPSRFIYSATKAAVIGMTPLGRRRLRDPGHSL